MNTDAASDDTAHCRVINHLNIFEHSHSFCLMLQSSYLFC